ncbi:hypothetical protein B0H19DRAFT_1258525 [Mycena capillaripes]|nr:hypothetical protein B0H19DRAFT_1258525 [Mycena capillaripes]
MASGRHPLPFLSLLALPFLLLLTPFVHAALTNLTIDDTNSTYFTFTDADSNPPSWAAITPGAPCVYCSAQPPTDRIHNQTWHDGSVGSAGSFTFQGATPPLAPSPVHRARCCIRIHSSQWPGSAVYIYGIDLASPANISFILDDSPIPQFHYHNGTQQFVFDALFFAASNLSSFEEDGGVNHTVSWVLDKSRLNGTTGLFDYAIVTVEESTIAPSPSNAVPNQGSTSKTRSKSKNGTIIAAVVGTIAGLALLAGLIFLLLRRRSKEDSDSREESISEPDHNTPPQPRPQRVRDNYVVRPFVESALSLSQTQPSSLTTTPAPTMNQPEKTLDLSWTNPTLSVSALSVGSATSPLSTVHRDPEMSTLAPTITSGTTMSSSARERFLEDRLAIIEAHLQQHLPPPYQPPPEEV